VRSKNSEAHNAVLSSTGVGPSHHDIACLQVAGGGDGHQMWRVGSAVLNN